MRPLPVAALGTRTPPSTPPPPPAMLIRECPPLLATAVHPLLVLPATLLKRHERKGGAQPRLGEVGHPMTVVVGAIAVAAAPYCRGKLVGGKGGGREARDEVDVLAEVDALGEGADASRRWWWWALRAWLGTFHWIFLFLVCGRFAVRCLFLILICCFWLSCLSIRGVFLSLYVVIPTLKVPVAKCGGNLRPGKTGARSPVPPP